MKRGFSFEREQRVGRGKLLWATAIIVLAIGVDVATGGVLRSFGHSLNAHIWAATSAVRSSIFDSGYFSSHRALSQENGALRDEIETYKEDAAAYAALKEENAQLRAYLHMATTLQGITAPIVSSTLASPYGSFLIGAGSADTVSAGDLVLTESGFVIGVVTDVDLHRSAVKEVFAADTRIDVVIGKNAAKAEGSGGGNAKLQLPRAAAISIGEPVISPSLGSRPVGIVGNVASSSSSAEQTAYISVPVNLSTLRYVFIAH